MKETKTYPSFEEGQICAKLIKRDDKIILVDFDNEETEIFLTKDGLAWALCPNASNRKWVSVAKANEIFATTDTIELTYKASKHFGTSSKMPNEKLISYLPEDLQAEYKAIIDRAIEARNADKTQPKTELEKAQEKLARAQAALDKLIADSNN